MNKNFLVKVRKILSKNLNYFNQQNRIYDKYNMKNNIASTIIEKKK